MLYVAKGFNRLRDFGSSVLLVLAKNNKLWYNFKK